MSNKFCWRNAANQTATKTLVVSILLLVKVNQRASTVLRFKMHIRIATTYPNYGICLDISSDVSTEIRGIK